MSRKDFDLIANALVLSQGTGNDWQAQAQYERSVYAMASALATTNPRFDRCRFLMACGV